MEVPGSSLCFYKNHGRVGPLGSDGRNSGYEKRVPHQAEVVGKEGLCNQEGCDE